MGIRLRSISDPGLITARFAGSGRGLSYVFAGANVYRSLLRRLGAFRGTFVGVENRVLGAVSSRRDPRTPGIGALATFTPPDMLGR